jgi:hypothetical protein
MVDGEVRKEAGAHIDLEILRDSIGAQEHHLSQKAGCQVLKSQRILESDSGSVSNHRKEDGRAPLGSW